MKNMRALYTGGVPLGLSSTSLQVVQRGAGANMSVDVSIGDAHLVRPTSDYSFYVWQDAATNVVITTAPATNSRIDAIVAWVDTSVTNTSLNNSPGSLKFSAIVGTVAGSPVAPTDSAIQTALGSTVAWTRLANVTVGTSVTSIVNANISDQRSAISSRTAPADGTVTTAKIAPGAVTQAKLSTAAGEIGGAWLPWTPTTVGWSSIGTGQYYYTSIGKTVIISYYVDGTSNNTQTTITLPFAASTHINTWESTYGLGINGGSVLSTGLRSFVETPTNPNLLIFATTYSGATWSASGVKSVRGTFVYERA